MMRAYKERVGAVTWIVLDGKAGNLAQDLAGILSTEPMEILVDFTHAGPIGATDGLALCRHLRKAHGRGALVVLGAVRKRSVKRFLATSGLSDWFPCEEDLPSALSRFREGTRRSFLGEMLVDGGFIDEDQLDRALRIQAAEDSPRKLGTILTDEGLVDKGALVRVLFRQKASKLAA